MAARPIVMGATTYEWVVGHENLVAEPQKWGEWYGDRPSSVFTHRDLPQLPGADITFVQGDVRPVHEAMVSAAGDRNIWVVGGGELAGSFADAGLLDDLILGVAPVTWGAGARCSPSTDVVAPTLTNVARSPSRLPHVRGRPIGERRGRRTRETTRVTGAPTRS